MNVPHSGYLETQTILHGLEFALAKGGFSHNPAQKKTALALIKDLKGNKSFGGRHQVLTGLLKKGATLQEMIKATGSSRRTVFRYLNHFEDAGMNIHLEGGKYRFLSTSA